jgi:DNA helicase-2/ATP-dependent DNA helicase PcrA
MGLSGFLEEVSLVSDLDRADFGSNAVTLMTIHAAKGLEFPVVFMTGLEEGVFPTAGHYITQTNWKKSVV